MTTEQAATEWKPGDPCRVWGAGDIALTVERVEGEWAWLLRPDGSPFGVEAMDKLRPPAFDGLLPGWERCMRCGGKFIRTGTARERPPHGVCIPCQAKEAGMSVKEFVWKMNEAAP